MAAHKSLTYDEYWRIHGVVRGDVESAIKSNHTYLTINDLSVSDRNAEEKLNEFPEFWLFNAYALQTTFFMALGRLFDSRKDSHSILKLVDATIANPQLFTKTALHARKRMFANIHGSDPDSFAPRVTAAWEPGAADLMALKTELEPHHLKFKVIYQPIRHTLFAHRSMESEADIFSRFQKTNIKEVEDILRFLHTLLCAIREMAWKGKRINLVDTSEHDKWVEGIKTKTADFIRRLP